MPRLLDITGYRFGRLTVIAFSHKEKRVHLWKCLCECGNEKVIRGQHLRYGATQSCGCLRTEGLVERVKVHGMRQTPTYKAWCHMRGRCFNKNNARYENYGARGITVCDHWQSFANFYKDMGHSWFPGASLERKDVNGNYEPSNCTWIPRSEQSKNRTTSIFLDTPWGKLIAKDAAIKLGIKPSIMYWRIDNWPRSRWLEPPRNL